MADFNAIINGNPQSHISPVPMAASGNASDNGMAGMKGMKIAAGGANDTYLNKAVAHLNRETQRGEHAPMVGGYQHDDSMR